MSIAIIGGTFNRLHAGHRALLSAARAHSHLLIGLSSDGWARARKIRPVLPYAKRQQALVRAMRICAPKTTYTIFELDDPIGPAASDCGADTLLLSTSTAAMGERINRLRRRSGLAPLRLTAVPLVLAQDGFPLSSSRIQAGVIDEKGRRRAPLRVAIGSDNPSKIKGARSALRRAFPHLRIDLRAFKVPSGVHEQPIGPKLVRAGALNRARAAARAWPACDYAIGQESGLLSMDGSHFDLQFCALHSPLDGWVSWGCSMGFPLPKPLGRLVVGPGGKPRRSLGDAVDMLSGQSELGRRGGALAFLSRGMLERSEMSEQAVLCAMVERLSPI